MASLALDALAAHGTPAANDLIPVLPVGQSVLESMKVSDFLTYLQGTLVAGSGVTITNAPGSITISATGISTPVSVSNGGTGQTSYTDGQLLIGNGSTGGLNKATLTAGTGISITNSHGGITIAATGGAGPVAPNLLKFGPPTLLPYFDPQAESLINITDNFATTGSFTLQPGATAPSFSVSGNVGTVSSGGSAFANWVETSDTYLVAPQVFVALTVNSIPSYSGGYSNLGPCIAKDTGNWLVAFYDQINHLIQIQEANGGSITSSASYSFAASATFTLGLSLVNGSATAWVKSATQTDGHWVLAAMFGTSFNFSAVGALSGWKSGYQASFGGAASWNIANLQIGRAGGVGLRDIKAVVNEDWTTYQPSGDTVYFTASVSDAQGSGYQGVFSLNLDSQVITQTGVIYNQRAGYNYSDNAGHMIVYSNGDRDIILSSWGNGFNNSTPVHLLYEKVTSGSVPDPLTSQMTLLTGTATMNVPLPNSALGAYDPALGYDAANSRWLCAYTATIDCTFANSGSKSLFWPVLAYASSPTGSWTLIGADYTLQGNWEGTSLFNYNGLFYVLTGGPQFRPVSSIPAQNDSRVYDATMTYVGGLVGATFNGKGNTQPHPNVFQHPDGVHHVLLTFDGTAFAGGANLNWGQPNIQISTP